jgi:hypothetical protein
MTETNIEAELAMFKEAIHKLHEDLNYIRYLVATADATTRKLFQGIELLQQDLVDLQNSALWAYTHKFPEGYRQRFTRGTGYTDLSVGPMERLHH